MFQVVVAVAMLAVGALSFFMFLRIYREDMLKVAREIEAWDFPSKKQDDQEQAVTNER